MAGYGGAALVPEILSESQFPDDEPLWFGSDRDDVLLNRSTPLAANTALAGIVIDTGAAAETAATPANSLLISNITPDGDIVFFATRSGVASSKEYLRFDASGALTVFNEAGADLDWRVEGDTNPNLINVDAGLDAVAFGGGVPSTVAASFNNTTARTMGTATGFQINMPAQITNLTNGAATLAVGTAAMFDVPTWSATNAVTITQATTFYIVGIPVADTNVTFTNAALSLWVDAGAVRFDDYLIWGAGVAVVAGNYSVGRDADATNQLHFNVPTGATFEFSVNDAARLVISNTIGRLVVSQTTANYTLDFADPGAARTITVPDPGGADSFVFRADTATLTNKTFSGGTFSGTIAGTPAFSGATLTVNDDGLLRAGTDGDQVLVNRSTSLLANTALADVLIATVVGSAVPANSLIISNITANGDIVLYTTLAGGGASIEIIRMDSSAGLFVGNDGGADIDFRFEGDTNTNLLVLDAGNDAVSFGGPTIAGTSFTLRNITSRTMESGSGAQLHINTQTTNFNNTSGTISSGVTVLIANQTWTNANATLTVTDPTTLWIEGPPIASTNVSFTNTAVALRVTGASLFTTGVYIGVVTNTNTLLDDASNGAGTTTLYIGNASINVTSDMRLKRDILTSYVDAMNIFRQLRVVDFAWDDPSDTAPVNRNSRGRYVGMLAQETIDLVPWIVNAPDRTCWECRAGLRCERHLSSWCVEYEHMAGLFVRGFQQVDARLMELESLKARVAVLEAELRARS